jgi:hypothetical protein
MEEECGGGQGLTKGCGAKGRRRRRKLSLIRFLYKSNSQARWHLVIYVQFRTENGT